MALAVIGGAVNIVTKNDNLQNRLDSQLVHMAIKMQKNLS